MMATAVRACKYCKLIVVKGPKMFEFAITKARIAW